MKAVVFHGVGDIRLETVREPKIKEPTDALIRITASAICGTDLHMVRGTLTGMKPGTILGHEAVGVIEEIGKDVRNLRKGDRVVVPSSISCGYCSYCRAGYQSQCDVARKPEILRNKNARMPGPGAALMAHENNLDVWSCRRPRVDAYRLRGSAGGACVRGAAAASGRDRAAGVSPPLLSQPRPALASTLA